MGFRCPSTPSRGGPPAEEPEASLFEAQPPLGGRQPAAPPGQRGQARGAAPGTLCVEAGGPAVRLPAALSCLEDFVDLVGVVEDAAARLGCRWCSRLPPPAGPSLVRLLVTPDPGVLEVNVHPASTWPSWWTSPRCPRRRRATAWDRDVPARRRHAGTGGGNHLTWRATPADSPLLRRPDLLRSIITYWQHHPSLSYVFSGASSADSQAPRVDEARHESLYELEIASRTGAPDRPRRWGTGAGVAGPRRGW